MSHPRRSGRRGPTQPAARGPQRKSFSDAVCTRTARTSPPATSSKIANARTAMVLRRLLWRPAILDASDPAMPMRAVILTWMLPQAGRCATVADPLNVSSQQIWPFDLPSVTEPVGPTVGWCAPTPSSRSSRPCIRPRWVTFPPPTCLSRSRFYRPGGPGSGSFRRTARPVCSTDRPLPPLTRGYCLGQGPGGRAGSRPNPRPVPGHRRLSSGSWMRTIYSCPGALARDVSAMAKPTRFTTSAALDLLPRRFRRRRGRPPPGGSTGTRVSARALAPGLLPAPGPSGDAVHPPRPVARSGRLDGHCPPPRTPAC